MNHPDTQLKLALAKMLPETVEIREQHHGLDPRRTYWWRDGQGRQIVDTELLHLCWLAEHSLDEATQENYLDAVYSVANPESMLNDDWNLFHASWQQRTIALAKVNGIEIV